MEAYLIAALYSLRGFVSTIRIVDVFDVMIIALLLYLIIILFKRTHSWTILLGIGMLAVLYSISQVFHLYLTSLVLQSFFAVSIVVLVIIFHQELRRFFELLSFWNTRQFKPKQGSSGLPFDINEVLQAVAYLSKEKHGALIIFPGAESIGRFLEGGRQLDGLITEELLVSIFDPHSMGHDGAVIVDKNRIAKFGVHLPLSPNFKQLGKRGTRHSAALGITEHTDAFALVVSEERGSVSIAYGGKLKELKNIEELEISFKKFYKDIVGSPSGSFWSDIIRRNSFEKMIAMSAALLIWFFFSFQAETIQRTFTLPITYRNLPENLFILESDPNEISVTLVSRGQLAFERIDERTIEAAIDAKDFTEGMNRIVVVEHMIQHPSNFSVVGIEPSHILIRALQFNSFDVSIHAKTTGSPAAGFVIQKIEITPETIALLVPDGTLVPENVITEPIDISGLKESKTFSSKIILPARMRFRDSISPSISVRITVSKK